MKVLVVSGSRYLPMECYDVVAARLSALVSGWVAAGEAVMLRVGGCRGADALAARWAQDNGFTIIPTFADWKRYGRAAGPIRNKAMIDGADGVVVFMADGLPCRGSHNAADLARAAGVPLRVVTICSARPWSESVPAPFPRL